MAQLTKHFSEAELNPLRLPLTRVLRANLLLLAVNLEAIRAHLGGRKIRITSGYRNIATELANGRAGGSRHVLAEAVDIIVEGLTPKLVQDRLESWWPGGMGRGRTFTHIDIRHLSTLRKTTYRFARWDY